jgi:tetratricopeptide (TPR) repeat protein
VEHLRAPRNRLDMNRPSVLRFPVITALLSAILLAGCGSESKNKRHAANAESAFNRGDYNRAEIEYRNLLQADANNAHVLRRLGTIWLERGGPFQAFRYLGRAKQLDPADVNGRVKLGTVLLSMGERSAARTEGREALEIEPGNGEAILLFAMSSAGEKDAVETEARLKSAGASAGPSVPLAQAVLAMRRGDLPAAKTAIDAALALDSGSLRGLAFKAEWHQARGEAEAADECYQAALRVAPPRSPERVAYATFLLGKGKREAAVDFLKETAAHTPDFLPAWRWLARDALARKDYVEAGNLLENVFSKDRTDLEATLLQSQAWLAQGGEKEIKEAVVLLEKLREIHPSNPLVSLQLAKVLLTDGKTVQAASALSRTITLNPEFREAILMDAGLKLREAKAREAGGAMEDWLNRHPADGSARLILADAYRAQGRLEDAVKLLQESVEAPGADGETLLRLGMLLMQQDKLEEARTSFERAEELAPNSIAVAARLVEWDLMAGNFDAATNRAMRLREKNPEAATSHYLVATAFARQSKWADAENALAEALRLEPGFMPAYGLMIRCHVAGGRTEEAVEWLEQAIEREPENLSALMSLATIHQEAGRASEAKACYEQILRKRPSFVPALNNLAALLSESPGELDRARELANKALSHHPEEASISDTLGWIHYKLGSYKRAYALLAEASAKLPDNPVVSFHLGMASCAMADEAAARRAFSSTATSAGDSREKKEAAKHLSFLDSPDEKGTAGISRLQERIRREPLDMVARMRLAVLLQEERQHVAAAETYAGAITVNPDLHQANLQLATLHSGPLGNPREALTYAERARELAPDDAETAGLLGKLVFLEGRHVRADQLLQESYSKRKDDTPLMIDVAWAAYSVGRVGEAERIMETVRDNARNPDQKAAAAKLLDFAGRDPGADRINEALAEDPSHVPALMARARALEQQKDTAAALRDYRKALEIFPKFHPAREAADRILAAEVEKP